MNTTLKQLHTLFLSCPRDSFLHMRKKTKMKFQIRKKIPLKKFRLKKKISIAQKLAYSLLFFFVLSQQFVLLVSNVHFISLTGYSFALMHLFIKICDILFIFDFINSHGFCPSSSSTDKKQSSRQIHNLD